MSSTIRSDSNPTIKLLTFNTWGLKYVSKFRKQRLSKLAEELSSSDDHDYDVVALQEIWCREDWEYIDALCSERYPYRRWFSSGILSGPGLAVLSKIPIESTFLYRFPINGRPSAFFRGDWYVGKSVSITKLKPLTKSSSPIAILNSHMHAPYSLTGDAAYSTHRSCQAWDFAELASTLAKAGYAVVIVGDLNSRPGSLPYRILEDVGLKDSWEIINGTQSLSEIAQLTPEMQIKIGGTTCDSTLNTWRSDRRPDEACRLDYALIDHLKLVPLEAKVEFTETIPNVGSYSDHFAYTTTLEVLPVKKHSTLENQEENKARIYQDLKSEINGYLKQTTPFQRNWRLAHFYISYLLVIGCLVAITVPAAKAAWSSVLIALLAVILAVTGIINLMIAMLFGRLERRNLNEVLMEVNDKIRFLKESNQLNNSA